MKECPSIRATSRLLEPHCLGVLAVLWISYVGFYIGRVNVSAALPGLRGVHGWTEVDSGWLTGAFFGAYAVGLLVNSRLPEHLHIAILLPIALASSAFLNVLLPMAYTPFIMKLLWAINGYVQSVGWPLVVNTAATCSPVAWRGRVAAVLGSSYIIGGAIGIALAGQAVSAGTWRSAFYVPAGIMASIAAVVSVSLWALHAWGGDKMPLLTTTALGTSRERGVHVLDIIRDNRVLWRFAVALLFLNIVRYGFIVWAPTFLFSVGHLSISRAAFSSTVFPLAGCIGCGLVGWSSDRAWNGRRAPAISICLGLTALLALVYFDLVKTGKYATGLVVIGFLGAAVFGAHMLIVAAVPIDSPTRKATVAAFIDSVGYLGVAINALFTGSVAGGGHWNWIFGFWAFAAVASGAMVLPLSSTKVAAGSHETDMIHPRERKRAASAMN